MALFINTLAVVTAGTVLATAAFAVQSKVLFALIR
jgi:hypothetical protein